MSLGRGLSDLLAPPRDGPLVRYLTVTPEDRAVLDRIRDDVQRRLERDGAMTFGRAIEALSCAIHAAIDRGELSPDLAPPYRLSIEGHGAPLEPPIPVEDDDR